MKKPRRMTKAELINALNKNREMIEKVMKRCADKNQAEAVLDPATGETLCICLPNGLTSPRLMPWNAPTPRVRPERPWAPGDPPPMPLSEPQKTMLEKVWRAWWRAKRAERLGASTQVLIQPKRGTNVTIEFLSSHGLIKVIPGGRIEITDLGLDHARWIFPVPPERKRPPMPAEIPPEDWEDPY